MYAAGTCGWKSDYGVTAVMAYDRSADHQMIIGEIGSLYDAFVLFHPCGSLFGEFAFVEVVDALVGDLTVCLCEIRLLEVVVLWPGFLFCVEEDCCGGFEFFQVGMSSLKSSGECTVDWETVLSYACGVAQVIREVHVTCEKGCIVICGEGAGDADCQCAGFAGFGHWLAVLDVHIAIGGTGGHFSTVDGKERSVGSVDQHETPAADSGIVCVHDAEGEGDGNGGVDGISAFGDCGKACISCDGVDGCHGNSNRGVIGWFGCG